MLKKLGRVGRKFFFAFFYLPGRAVGGIFGDKYLFACSRMKLGLKLEDYRCSKMHSQPYLRPK